MCFAKNECTTECFTMKFVNCGACFSGPRPLDAYKKAIPFRLAFGILFALLVQWTRNVRDPGVESFPIYYYIVILSAYGLHQVRLGDKTLIFLCNLL